MIQELLINSAYISEQARAPSALKVFPGRLMIIQNQMETNHGQRAVNQDPNEHTENSALDLTSNSIQCFEKCKKTRRAGGLTASLHGKDFIHIKFKWNGNAHYRSWVQKHLSKLLIAEDSSFNVLQNPIKKKMNSHSYGHSLGKLTLSSDLMYRRIIRSTFRNNSYKKEGKESRIGQRESWVVL